MLKPIKDSIAELMRNPSVILTNPYTGWTSVVAMVGGFLADQFGTGYWIVLVIALMVFLAGVWQELRKTDVYRHEAIPLPIVINIANPASSENALGSLY